MYQLHIRKPNLWKALPATLLLMLVYTGAFSTHLMGGSMTYTYSGSGGGMDNYHVTLKIYRYCDASGGGTAPLDFSMLLGIYTQDPLNPNNDKVWYTTENLTLTSSQFITPPAAGPTCNFSTTVCVEEGIFEADISLPPGSGGYHLMVERCCRNGNIVNLSTPGSIGMTYSCFIPPAPILNSSPQFSDLPVPYMCAGDTISIVNNAVDPDGDSLVYAFVTPYSGYSSSGNPIPDPQIDNNPYTFPIPPVLYNPGYSMAAPFGPGGYSSIDPVTGLTNYMIPNQGFYVVAIEIREYRNGQLIATIRRDLQLIAITCPPNTIPALSNANGSGTTNYTITEGQTICFPVTFTDPNGDSLYLTASGPIFNSAVVNPPATLATASGDNIVTSQFCWSTDCGQANSSPYQFTVSVTDNGCPPKIKNVIYSIKVNPATGPPQAAVSIMQDPPGPVCTGTLVNFTALPTFGGTNPVFQWQLNGMNVGSNSSTWSSSTLNNGDVITVSLLSNSTCVVSNNAVSPPLVMVVNPFAAPSVTIAAAPPGPICSGTPVNFTALPVNPGPTPVYQWTVNGINAGSNSTMFSSSTLSAGNQVGVSLTANAACPAASSNTITMDVSPVVTPSVTIVSSTSSAICPGESVTFTAYPLNGGTNPVYQWQVNGVNAGAGTNSFSSSTLNNGDVITVILTSSEICVSTPTAVSNQIAITVTAPSAPTVSIAVNPAGPICAADNVIFTATTTLGGASPSYQWKVNGINTGPNSPTFATASLANGDQVSVVLTSSLGCAVPATANSNVIVMTVNPVIAASVAISMNPAGAVCPGTPVTFTALAVNGGTSPSYQWQVNGANSGTNSSTFTTSSLTNGNIIRVIMTSNGVCVSPVTSTSNQLVASVLPAIVPSVTISQPIAWPVCQGTPVTFTAAGVNTGPSPVYQWYVNGTPTGTNAVAFTTASLANGDNVTVQMTSNAVCPTPATVTSNVIVAGITPSPVPSVTINAIPGGPVCAGTTVSFTAFPLNGGPGQIVRWRVNGVPVAFGTTWSSSTLLNGDVVDVRLISNAVCAAPVNAFSNQIIMVVNPLLTPAVTITATPAGPVCAGTPVTFNASAVNGGSIPAYQWFKNGVPSGSNSPAFSFTPVNNDTIKVVMNSSEVCLTTPSDTSNIITAVVNPNLTPAVSISAAPAGPVCPGDAVTFTATAVNGGSNPAYQWSINSVNAGTNSATFSSSGLTNGAQVGVTLTSNATCLTTPTAAGIPVIIQVSPNVTPQITISVSPPGRVCDLDTLTFSAVILSGGTSPGINWRVNSTNTGVTGTVFVSNSLNNGDIVDAVLTSNAFCALPVTDTSNAIAVAEDPLLTPSSVISADPPGIFCDGTTITYSSVNLNQGNSPGYAWLLNGIQVLQGSDTLVSSAFQNGDTLQMVLTSSERCLWFNPAYSNELIIQRYPILIASIDAPQEICEGQSITVTGSASGGNGGPYFYHWNNTTSDLAVQILTPDITTTYILTVYDSCSTPRTDTATVTVHPLPDVSFTAEPVRSNILFPYYQFTDHSTNAYNWFWDFGDGALATGSEPQHSYLEPGSYSVLLVVTSEYGCADSARQDVYLDDVVIYYMPNSFTPNNDGINDLFGPVGHSVESYDLSVFNRWGQEVFHSIGLEKWNGLTPSGDKAPEGLYVYRLSVKNDSQKKVLTGTVTLVR
ncbi:MAG TPA: PKD domain-containing protein [Bacteroidia bacterium]|nr:PKD domain-containing protein [Bacteroidia bacterium]